MAIKIFIDIDSSQSVMYDDVEEYAFGPVFGADEDSHDFLEWAESIVAIFQQKDVRNIDRAKLGHWVDLWRQEVKDNENEARAEAHYSDTAAATLPEQMEKAKKLKL